MSRMSHCCTRLPLLADIHEQNVAFVLCTSETETAGLCILKELLIKTLFSLAHKPTDSMFGIVSCTSQQVLKWQKSLVECSLRSVTEAAAWIRGLQSSSGASAVMAVAAALEDPFCQAVYLFTSGLPEHSVEEISSHLKEAEQAHPVHIVYLVGSKGENEHGAQEIMEEVAKASGGSFQAVSLSSDEAIPGCSESICRSDCICKQPCSSLLMGHHATAQFPSDAWSLVKEDFVDWSPEVYNLQRGVQVLARRETDGFYYLGHIVQEVKGSRGHVLIEFQRSRQSRKGKILCRMQETPLYDVIHYEDARWQPLAPGDAVLAPWDKKGERYGPGVILQVAEAASSHSAFKNSKVLVNFWNGQTRNVSADVALKIPRSLSERIVLELQMPLAARQMLVEQNPDYPYVVPPGYRASGPCQQSYLGEMHWQETPKDRCVCAGCSSARHPLCHCCFQAWESFRSPICTVQRDDAFIPGTKLTKEELSRKIEEQLSKGRLPISGSNEKEQSKKLKEADNVADLESQEEMESKFTKPNKDHSREGTPEASQEGPGTVVDVAVNTDKCITQHEQQRRRVLSQLNRMPLFTQPCQRSPSRKTYAADTSQLQAIFNWVDQSLKEDHSVVKSVLPIRRSYSAPPIQRIVTKAVTQDGPREMVVNTARMEFKRKKMEQRQLKEEQRREEEHLRRELLLDNKRQRSLQRTLQGSQKQQENIGSWTKWLGKQQLQAARAETGRGESRFQEDLKNKEEQRLEFLKAQRKQREKQLAEHQERIDDHEKKRLELLRNRMKSMQNSLEAAAQERDTQRKEKAAAKSQKLRNQDRTSQQVEKEEQKHKDLQQYLREQSLLMLRASLLP
ncbi:uncharacterized protein LOC118091114 [Zootoca vivipara]|uniref:uncharacterized protein LOC118091114 n=1 Tax=Zootoca vivipara TaxID=8524 RepID=UPI00293BFB7B|nr:uncharacterized protein LOC118091114 [Zootoca vivipara]